MPPQDAVPPPAVRLVTIALSDPATAPLLAGLADEYERRYGANDEMAAAGAADFDPPDGAFLVAVEAGGRTVAGGGFRRLAPGRAELKRMWTDAEWRRRGLAGLVLGALERVAAERGYAELWLETGAEQPEAIAFYLRHGYERVADYGRYRGEASVRSFRKRLVAGEGNGPGC